MAKKDELLKRAGELNITLEGGETNAQLEEKIKEVGGELPLPPQSAERMFTKSEVEAMLKHVQKGNGDGEPAKADDRKKVRMARIEGKLVVDFVNRNTDKFLPGVVIHAFNKWNENIKQYEAWLDVIFDDGSTKEMPLLYLVSNARPISCPVVREEKHDTSFSMGVVEKKVYEDSGRVSGMKGLGVMVDQMVKQEEIRFVISTPDGKEIEVPSYVVNIV